MSYSFEVKGKNKREAINAVRAALMEVAKGQPVHHEDFDQALANAQAVINNLKDDPDCDVGASINGSIWAAEDGVRSCSVSCSAYIVSRQT